MSRIRSRPLATVDEIVEALGGREAANARLRNTSNSTLSNWKKRGIPRARYLEICELLREVGRRPSPDLFIGGPDAAVLA